MKNDARINFAARIMAIQCAGLIEKYHSYVKEHADLGKGITSHCLANHFCTIHKLDWKKHKKIIVEGKKNGEELQEEIGKVADQFIYVLKSVKYVLKELDWGESVEVGCPLCGGIMHISRSGYNGHFHIGCDKCGFYAIQ